MKINFSLLVVIPISLFGITIFKKYAPHTGIVPLRISKNNTVAAASLLLIRKTLVAPGFFEPVVRGSGKPKNLHTNIALEIEPIK